MDNSSGSHAETTESSDVAFLEPAFWRKLAEAGTTEDIAAAWLRLQCQQIQGAVGGAVMLSRAGSDGFCHCPSTCSGVTGPP